ncbi:MAG: transglutaminase-like domain-containing protein [Rhodospirillales bacterium]
MAGSGGVLADDIRRALGNIGRRDDADFPIAEAALHLAAIRLPGLNLGPYERHLARLTKEVADFVGPGTPTLAGQYEALIQVIDRRYGYGGNESVFEDLDAANLARVIDTRRGLPVALGVVYIEVCKRLGWSLVGLDFPGRFLVRLEDAGGRMILDLFEGGRELTPPDLRGMLKTMAGADAELHPRYLSEMTARQVVLRLEDNIRVRQMQRGELADAADTLSLMLLIAPDAGHLWREAGMVNARLDRVASAVAALEEYLKRAPGEENGYEASLLLQELRAKLN